MSSTYDTMFSIYLIVRWFGVRNIYSLIPIYFLYTDLLTEGQEFIFAFDKHYSGGVTDIYITSWYETVVLIESLHDASANAQLTVSPGQVKLN